MSFDMCVMVLELGAFHNARCIRNCHCKQKDIITEK